MTKSIKKSTIPVQNPAEKIQEKQDEKSITSKKKKEILISNL
jgi:hypothetical protein